MNGDRVTSEGKHGERKKNADGEIESGQGQKREKGKLVQRSEVRERSQ